jgi:adenylate kinase
LTSIQFSGPFGAPGPVLLLGAPGVGKGTQAKLLVSRFQIPQISTGDLFRANMELETDLGLQAKSLVNQGKLVPDSLVNEMVALRLKEKDLERGYVLDGFPRTAGQAQWLDKSFELRKAEAKVRRLRSEEVRLRTGELYTFGAHYRPKTQKWNSSLVAININVSYDLLLERVTGRVSCPICKTIYNTFLNPPRVPGTCDLEGAPLEQRADDRPEVFRQRMQTFRALTAPVIENYRESGRFEEVDGSRSVGDVAEDIVAALSRLRKTTSQANYQDAARDREDAPFRAGAGAGP